MFGKIGIVIVFVCTAFFGLQEQVVAQSEGAGAEGRACVELLSEPSLTEKKAFLRRLGENPGKIEIEDFPLLASALGFKVKEEEGFVVYEYPRLRVRSSGLDAEAPARRSPIFRAEVIERLLYLGANNMDHPYVPGFHEVFRKIYSVFLYQFEEMGRSYLDDAIWLLSLKASPYHPSTGVAGSDDYFMEFGNPLQAMQELIDLQSWELAPGKPLSQELVEAVQEALRGGTKGGLMGTFMDLAKSDPQHKKAIAYYLEDFLESWLKTDLGQQGLVSEGAQWVLNLGKMLKVDWTQFSSLDYIFEAGEQLVLRDERGRVFLTAGSERKNVDELADQFGPRSLQHWITKHLVGAEKYPKARVLSSYPLDQIFADEQAWISIHRPDQAQALLASFVEEFGKGSRAYQLLGKEVQRNLGVPVKELGEKHFKFYPDEIIDSLAAVAKDFGGQWSQSQAVLQESQGLKLRFFRRNEDSLYLGKVCGDCTAPGSINFGNSLTWFINPLYQIVEIYYQNKFVGKVHVTPATVNGKETLFMDAMEFHPQTTSHEEYGERARVALAETFEFLAGLAERQGMELVALALSNQAWANEFLRDRGVQLRPVQRQSEVAFLNVEDEVAQALNIPKARVLPFWYQVSDVAQDEAPEAGGEVMTDGEKLAVVRADPKTQELETKLINPLQAQVPGLGARISEARDVGTPEAYKALSREIMAMEGVQERVKAILGFAGANYSLSPEILGERLRALYPPDSMRSHSTEGKTVFVLKREGFLYRLRSSGGVDPAT